MFKSVIKYLFNGVSQVKKKSGKILPPFATFLREHLFLGKKGG